MGGYSWVGRQHPPKPSRRCPLPGQPPPMAPPLQPIGCPSQPIVDQRKPIVWRQKRRHRHCQPLGQNHCNLGPHSDILLEDDVKTCGTSPWYQGDVLKKTIGQPEPKPEPKQPRHGLQRNYGARPSSLFLLPGSWGAYQTHADDHRNFNTLTGEV